MSINYFCHQMGLYCFTMNLGLFLGNGDHLAVGEEEWAEFVALNGTYLTLQWKSFYHPKCHSENPNLVTVSILIFRVFFFRISKFIRAKRIWFSLISLFFPKIFPLETLHTLGGLVAPGTFQWNLNWNSSLAKSQKLGDPLV